MAKSNRITHNEIRSIFRLVNEVRELGAVPEAWRTHLLQQLLAMLQMRIGFVIQSRPFIKGATAPLASVLSVGLNGREYRAFMEFATSGIESDPGNEARVKLFLNGKHFTRVRRDFVPDDDAWYRSDTIQRFSRPLEVDDNVHSEFFLPDGQGSQTIYLLREQHDRRPIGQRETRLLHLVHSEIHRIWELSAIDHKEAPLPPRMAQTLSLLRAGYSEKQIAFRMQLSRHSTHDLIKRLHRKYNVESRYELLEASRPSSPKFYPAITL